jgi:aminopeptidase C
MQGATLVVREHKLYSAYVAHKHSHNISFTKLCETNQSHSGRCDIVASLCEIELRVLLSTLGCLLFDTFFRDRLQAC